MNRTVVAIFLAITMLTGVRCVWAQTGWAIEAGLLAQQQLLMSQAPQTSSPTPPDATQEP